VAFSYAACLSPTMKGDGKVCIRRVFQKSACDVIITLVN
jgi:hypothetical protein